MRRKWSVLLLALSIGFFVAALSWIVYANFNSSREDFTPQGNRESSVASANPTGSPSSSPQLYPAPIALRIPAINVQTTIVPVGLDSQRNMEIPTDIRLAGWYDLGVPPGAEVGSAVLVAHRDGRAQGRGVFYSIGSLTIGDKITVIRNDKSKVVYSVASRELIKRKNFAKTAPELFAIDGPHRLTLISCGGTYDRNNGGYQANVIVTALAD